MPACVCCISTPPESVPGRRVGGPGLFLPDFAFTTPYNGVAGGCMSGSQQALWHDTLEDALRHVVEGLGGPKRVAGDLWPARPVIDAARHLNRCLDPERPEKLGLDEVIWILKAGAAADVHIGMAFLAQACGYESPRKVNPETERDRLMREYIHSVEQQQALVRRLEALHGCET